MKIKINKIEMTEDGLILDYNIIDEADNNPVKEQPNDKPPIDGPISTVEQFFEFEPLTANDSITVAASILLSSDGINAQKALYNKLPSLFTTKLFYKLAEECGFNKTQARCILSRPLKGMPRLYNPDKVKGLYDKITLNETLVNKAFQFAAKGYILAKSKKEINSLK